MVLRSWGRVSPISRLAAREIDSSRTMPNAMNPDSKVAVVGLGYVGLPLALAFGRKFDTIGFDVNPQKIASYRSGEPLQDECDTSQFRDAKRLRVTADAAELREADFVVVAIPTPVTESRRPDLEPLIAATITVGRHLKRGAVVVYESTVYPGVTDEVCAPILERESGLKRGEGFRLGYSPERINPGDREH